MYRYTCHNIYLDCFWFTVVSYHTALFGCCELLLTNTNSSVLADVHSPEQASPKGMTWFRLLHPGVLVSQCPGLGEWLSIIIIIIIIM